MSSSAGSRVLPLDGLRTFAIIGVVLYHLHVQGFGGGFVGVNVFFVLSGYLITSLLLKEQMQTGTIRLGRFWVRRVLRLYPTLLAVVLVAVALWPLVGDYTYNDLDAWPAALVALTYTGNFARAYAHLSQGVFAPGWSLAMEEQFYLVWPPVLAFFLYRGFRRRSVAWFGAAAVLASCVLAYVLYETPKGIATPDIYFSPVANVAPLLLGCVLALALTHERARTFFAGRVGAWSTWIGIGVIVAIAAMLGNGSLIGDDWKNEPLFFGVLLPAVGLGTTLLIAGVVSRKTALGSFLGLRPLAWFGRNVSYSLYLWHMIVMALLDPFVSGLGGKLLLLGASVAVATASHFVIEKPFLRVKKRFEPASWSVERTRETGHESAGQETVESLRV
ncbi:acyltransferase [Frondihabitans peucedani]|uniref:Acyltransferase n=1 Tax=Frondihabitans peucedani TaxID=598626 RepID=A0ABP8E0R0_9MICO